MYGWNVFVNRFPPFPEEWLKSLFYWKFNSPLQMFSFSISENWAYVASLLLRIMLYQDEQFWLLHFVLFDEGSWPLWRWLTPFTKTGTLPENIFLFLKGLMHPRSRSAILFNPSCAHAWPFSVKCFWVSKSHNCRAVWKRVFLAPYTSKWVKKSSYFRLNHLKNYCQEVTDSFSGVPWKFM